MNRNHKYDERLYDHRWLATRVIADRRSPREVSQELGCPERAVYMRMHRCGIRIVHRHVPNGLALALRNVGHMEGAATT